MSTPPTIEQPGLDDDAAVYLERLRAAAPPPMHTLTPEQVRAGYLATAATVGHEGEPVAQVHDDDADGVPVRVYRPDDARGVSLFLHGGGWVVGTLDTYDHVCRALATTSGSTVVSVDYDLAPEARHPAAVLQGERVLRWASRLPGGDRLAVAGDSAGAHLATLVAARADVPLRALALVYPVVSPALDTPSARDNATGYGLETDGMRWYWRQYLPLQLDDVPATGPASSVEVPVDLLGADLARLPATLVLTAGFDPLRDEGRALADAVEAAGVPVERLAYDGQVHGFFRTSGVIPTGRRAQREVGEFLRRRLAS